MPKYATARFDCAICANKSICAKKIMSCGKCNTHQCFVCVREYHKTSSAIECMACKNKWGRSFVVRNFNKMTANYLLVQKTRDLLLSRQKALVPFSGRLVERVLHRRACDKRIIEINKQLGKADKANDFVKVRLLLLHLAEIAAAREQSATSNRGNEHTMPCPVKGCSGVLVDHQCLSCSRETCRLCWEPKQVEAHNCNPDTVATVAELKTTTKPCPGCATPIFKINGCDQMWCPKCNVFFAWDTLKITKAAHNPEHVDYTRTGVGMLRDVHDVPCGGYPSTENAAVPLCVSYLCYHIASVFSPGPHGMLAQYYPTPVSPVDTRVKFMMNEISERKFASWLMAEHRNYLFKLDAYAIISLFRDTTVDIFNVLYANEPEFLADFAITQSAMAEIEGIAKYCLAEFKDTVRSHGKSNVKLNDQVIGRLMQYANLGAPFV